MPPLKLFISYSHKDDEWRTRLEAHLALLKRQRVFDVWTDHRIEPGEQWAEKIEQALAAADVILLLVSADFLASDYCYDKELGHAMARDAQGSARVVPVIVRKCDWHGAPFAKLEALPPGGKPIARHPDGEDEAFTAVATGLRAVANSLQGIAAPGDAGTLVPDSPPLPPAKKTWKIGPLEVPTWIAAVVLLGILGSAWWVIHGALEDARDAMRIGDYARAEQRLNAVPAWLAWWPPHAALAQQAKFGVKLASEDIRELGGELERLGDRSPHAADVAVFQGLDKYWREQTQAAIERFEAAVAADPRHIEAAYLAAGRHVEIARAAADEGAARAAIERARRLIDGVAKAAPGSVDRRKYANQRIELLVFLGEHGAAQREYLRIAQQGDAQSALLAAVLAWHLTDARALTDGLAVLHASVARSLGNESWKFDIGSARAGAEAIPLEDEADKRCLAAWVMRISQSLLEPAGERAAPDACKAAVKPDGVRAVVCSKLLGAIDARAEADPARPVLLAWTERPQRCDADVRAPPVLAPQRAKTLALAGIAGRGYR